MLKSYVLQPYDCDYQLCGQTLV